MITDDQGQISAGGRDPLTGRWAAGGPGRPSGTRNKVSAAALAAVRSMGDEAMAALRERVAAGDLAAIIFVLDRILPRGRVVELDGVSAEHVAEALRSGELTTTEAKDVATALARLAELGELDAMRARLEAIEERLGERRP